MCLNLDFKLSPDTNFVQYVLLNERIRMSGELLVLKKKIYPSKFQYVTLF